MYLECSWTEELQEWVSAGMATGLVWLGTLLTDVQLRNVSLREEGKADGMLPHIAHTTQDHQTIVLGVGPADTALLCN